MDQSPGFLLKTHYCTLMSLSKLSYVVFGCLILTECQPLERQLTVMSTSRLSQAFSQSTKKAYAAMFKTFLAFVAFMHWDVHQVNVFSLLYFVECLQFNGVKHTQMANYLSAIKSKFLIFGLDVTCFSDARLKFYQRAIHFHAPLTVKLNKIIDVPLLVRIAEQCDYMYMGQIYKALYLLSFFSFLCMSNLVSHSVWYLLTFETSS